LGENRCSFTVWAPEKKTILLHLVSPADRKIEMTKDTDGYFTAEVGDITPGSKYVYLLENGKEFPDPASFYQPEGVHGPSGIIDHNGYKWPDQLWRGCLLKDLIFYEIHVGAFTPEGTFAAIVDRLDDIKDCGINALEIMPVGQFPGERNWGYDGVFPFSVQNSYGGPDELKRLVDECHARGIAVFLDVVYNHLGPEGNYLGQFGPYFTDRYHTPWGNAINFDGAWSDGVRNYFCENAIYWLSNFHLDGLRLDAIHQIYDFGAIHIFNLLHDVVTEKAASAGRPFYLIAECDLNNPKVVQCAEVGGYGLDAQWLDDFHHALYVLLDKSGAGYYEDFGLLRQLSKAYTDGFVHSGEYVKYRNKKFGASSAGIPGSRFVVFNQNHDQVGNRADNSRLSALVDFKFLKVAAAALILSPYIPLLFMGEEYGETAPFAYFVSHSDKQLVEAVRQGRKKEFEKFNWETEPPDPQSPRTFNESKINWEKRKAGDHAALLQWNKDLIALRKNHLALASFHKNDIFVTGIDEGCLLIRRKSSDCDKELMIVLNFEEREGSYTVPRHQDKCILLLHSDQYTCQPGEIRFPVEVSAGEEIKVPGHSASVYEYRV
jgi:maltooligosyltrehalose trehalohydrolase